MKYIIAEGTRLLFLVEGRGYGNGNTLRKRYRVLEVGSEQTTDVTEQVSHTLGRKPIKRPWEGFTTTDNPEDVLYLLAMKGSIQPGQLVKYEILGVGNSTTLFGTGVKEYTPRPIIKPV